MHVSTSYCFTSPLLEIYEDTYVPGLAFPYVPPKVEIDGLALSHSQC